MGYAILQGEGSIRKKIRELFTIRTRSRRRVILGPLAALVPLDHFPDIRDVEVYSWGQEKLGDMKPLATLAERGVRINWVNPMHLRLYWVKGKGAVIGPGLKTSNFLAEFDGEDQRDLALYLDAGALMAVDEVLGPLLLDPTATDTFSDLQESCNLLWRLAEGITAAEPTIAYSTKGSPLPAKPGVPDYSPQIRVALETLEGRQRVFKLESWYNFLSEESQEDEGLLCFYHRPRTRRIENCCRFFAGLSGAFRA